MRADRTAVLVALLAAACPDTPRTRQVTWQLDPCGRRDPVEQVCDSGVATVEVGDAPTCDELGFVPGAACEDEGATCVRLRPLACEDEPTRVIASDEVLTCGVEPPDDDCPISRRDAKQDVAYLDAGARRRLADQVLGVRLATWRYRDTLAHGEGARLGYVLDDAPEAPFSGTGRVDLYAFTSAVLAAVQEQEQELARLRAEVAALREGVCAAP